MADGEIIFLVEGTEGDHEDRTDWIVAGYRSAESAQRRVDELTGFEQALSEALAEHLENEPRDEDDPTGEKWNAYSAQRDAIIARFRGEADDQQLTKWARYGLAETRLLP